MQREWKILRFQKTYLSSFSQNVIRAARSRCRLVRDKEITFTAHFATFWSNGMSSHLMWKAETIFYEQGVIVEFKL
jgi:hypothetical protein